MSLLYEASAKGISPADVLAALPVRPDQRAVDLVEGVAEHEAEIDELLSTHSRGWALDRMPVLDLTILRLGTFELLHRPDVPTPVVIDEAVELAKRFSTDDSGRFVNGMLSTIAKVARPPA
jgi:N utilization substance protein B